MPCCDAMYCAIYVPAVLYCLTPYPGIRLVVRECALTISHLSILSWTETVLTECNTHRVYCPSPEIRHLCFVYSAWPSQGHRGGGDTVGPWGGGRGVSGVGAVVELQGGQDS